MRYWIFILLIVFTSCGVRVPRTEKAAARKVERLTRKVEVITKVYPDLIDSATRVEYRTKIIQADTIKFTEKVLDFDTIKIEEPCEPIIKYLKQSFTGNYQYEDSLISIDIERNEKGEQHISYKIKDVKTEVKIIEPKVTSPPETVPDIFKYIIGIVVGMAIAFYLSRR
tara:strand:+ start:173 stop:679 length:507 start_codon:yes stop_codon:yes gene_type:complete